VLLKQIDALAEGHGGNRSRAIQVAVLEATRHDASGIPDEQEVLELLGESARLGNVSAMKMLLAYHREHPKESDDDPFAEFDELARERAARERGTWLQG
jgi:hypothetical protein